MDLDLASANEEAKARLLPALRGEGAHLSFDEAVEGFPERLMNEKLPNVPYTFWHQLEHIRITQWDILRYIQDPDHVSPPWPRGYWPSFDAKAEPADWNSTIRRYHADLEEFIDLVCCPGCNVLAPVAHMEFRSIFREALIVIDHVAYHLGEFVMGRQVHGAWKSELE